MLRLCIECGKEFEAIGKKGFVLKNAKEKDIKDIRNNIKNNGILTI